MPSLEEIALHVATAFVHTVVLVDDRAFESAVSDAPGLVVPPGRAAMVERAGDVPAAAPVIPVDAHPAGDEAAQATARPSPPLPIAAPAPAHTTPEALDAAGLIKLFAARGLVCAVIAPTPDEQVVGETALAAKRSDIVVVDWVIHGDLGGTASDIVCRILEGDRAANGRLRLIAIYTGESDLRAVSRKLLARIAAGGTEMVMSASELRLTGAHASIVVLAKENARIPEEDGEALHHRVSPRELPERLVQEFSVLTTGLVCGVAVQSLAHVRDHTHALIAELGRNVDAAFLTHRTLLRTPDEATGHALELVADEVSALIQSWGAEDLCGREPVRAAVGAMQHDPKPALERLGVNPPTLVGAAELAVDGLAAKRGKPAKVKDVAPVSIVFSPDETAARQSEADYVVAATQVRRHPSMKAPILTLGAILKCVSVAEEDGGGAAPAGPPGGARVDGADTEPHALDVAAPRSKYLVCIQPRCDSVRVEVDGRSFLFLAAKLDESKYQIIVRQGARLETIRVGEGAKDVEAFRFASTGEGVVRGTRVGDDFTFSSAEARPRQFVWVGQLKWSHAQRIANRFAADAARVGLDEPEFLRMRGWA